MKTKFEKLSKKNNILLKHELSLVSGGGCGGSDSTTSGSTTDSINCADTAYYTDSGNFITNTRYGALSEGFIE